jgi:formylglycine-generating enzyme required for sulfatase activity
VGVDQQRVLDVFRVAVDVKDSAERDALLDRECGSDADFKERVRVLLGVSKQPLRPPEPSSGDEARDLGRRPDGPAAAPTDEPSGLEFLTPSGRPGSLGRLGNYEVLGVLGRGGCGVVLRALDEKLRRTVAVKVLSRSWALDSQAHQRFLREARAGAAVRHDNVVQVYAVEDRPVPHLVMEFVPGESLQHRINRDGPLAVREAVRIAEQVALGLAAAHAQGLVHRDVKPSNILLEGGAGPRVRITDFGLARGEDDGTLTHSGMVVGTPEYMAPEQAYGYVVDHRADLFSLGTVLYVMACAKPPFRASSPIGILRSVVDDTPTPLADLAPAYPPWFCDLVARLHAKDPTARFASAKEVADLLAAKRAAGEDAPVMEPTLRTPVVLPAPRRSVPARTWYFAAAGLLLLVAAALGVAQLAGAFRPAATAENTDPPTANGGTGTDGPPPNPVVPVTPVVTPPAPPKPAVSGDRFKNAIGMEFVRVPKGKSWLGGGGGELGNREIDVEADFYLGAYEVTQGEWESLLGRDRNPSHFGRTGENKDDVRTFTDEELRRFPVDSVSWNDCQEFLTRLNAAAKPDGWVYRLPKLVEWEYACRGGPMPRRELSGFHFYLDRPSNTLPPGAANFADTGLKRTTKVGSYRANPLGLFDMHGNVFEYCDDADPTDDSRMLRGGFWRDGEVHCQAKGNGGGSPAARFEGGGLRVALVPAGGVPVAVRPFSD